MPQPAPSSPEHDAIANLIRDNRTHLDASTSTEDRARLAAREDILFEVLAAIASVRYLALDATGYRNTLFTVFDRWAPDFARPAGNHTALPDAETDAARRNAVNSAARIQDLQDELDRPRP